MLAHTLLREAQVLCCELVQEALTVKHKVCKSVATFGEGYFSLSQIGDRAGMYAICGQLWKR